MIVVDGLRVVNGDLLLLASSVEPQIHLVNIGLFVEVHVSLDVFLDFELGWLLRLVLELSEEFRHDDFVRQLLFFRIVLL